MQTVLRLYIVFVILESKPDIYVKSKVDVNPQDWHYVDGSVNVKCQRHTHARARAHAHTDAAAHIRTGTCTTEFQSYP